ncbi:MAG: DUF21 domain-containing protein [Spirochaetes bacterium]|nr:DUF21 domain-containing protein [Spirochaetota bacterium]
MLTVLLLLMNAFFVLAEFAAVKARPTQMDALAEKGNRQAKVVQYIQTHLDQFLSVCQIGITLASIGLGFVGEPALARLIKPLLAWLHMGDAAGHTAHGISVAVAYLFISFLHIVIGELVPKSMAIRRTEKAALFTAYPIIVFYYIFIVPLWILNSVSNALLFLMRIPATNRTDDHSEDEVRIILEQSQSTGVMSFRRLLYIENILDMGGLTVRNVMQSRHKTCSIGSKMTREEVNAIIAKYRYSRYPVIGEDDRPVGIVHVKDLYMRTSIPVEAGICGYVRACLKVRETDTLESVLTDMQRRGMHFAAVYDASDKWTGHITLEDVLEEIVGTIEEEYPLEKPERLSGALSSPDQILLQVEGQSITSAAHNALSRLPKGMLPLPVTEIMPHIAERERLGSSYVGRHLAIPHARLENITRAFVFVARMKTPIAAPTSKSKDTIRYLFILLTPAQAPRLHQILLSHIAKLFDSGYFEDRLADAVSPKELYDTIIAVEQTTDMS